MKEKEKEGSSDALHAKDKEIMGSAENLHETLSTRSMNKLREKKKIIQEQAKQILEKEKEGKKILAAH